MKPVKWIIFFGVLTFQLLICANASANPAFSEFDTAMHAIVLFLIYAYVFLIETTTLKFVLYGRDGPSWLRAFMVTIFVNALSAVAGLLSHIYYDADAFEFDPNFVSVFSISIGVECLTLLLIYMRSYPKRALLTGSIMNIGSYIFFLMIRFPK